MQKFIDRLMLFSRRKTFGALLLWYGVISIGGGLLMTLNFTFTRTRWGYTTIALCVDILTLAVGACLVVLRVILEYRYGNGAVKS